MSNWKVLKMTKQRKWLDLVNFDLADFPSSNSQFNIYPLYWGYVYQFESLKPSTIQDCSWQKILIALHTEIQHVNFYTKQNLQTKFCNSGCTLSMIRIIGSFFSDLTFGYSLLAFLGVGRTVAYWLRIICFTKRTLCYITLISSALVNLVVDSFCTKDMSHTADEKPHLQEFYNETAHMQDLVTSGLSLLGFPCFLFPFVKNLQQKKRDLIIPSPQI